MPCGPKPASSRGSPFHSLDLLRTTTRALMRMLNRWRGPYLLLLSLLLVSGCASVNSKLGSGQFGHPYSGVTMDAVVIKCSLQGPYAKENQETSYFISIPFSLLVATLFVVDIPFSLVADTLFLPFDLAVTPGPKSSSECRY